MTSPAGRFSLALAVVAVFAVATVAFVAGSPALDARQTTCPAGSELSEDGTACVSSSSDADESGVNDNVVTTTSCLQGVLSDDGQTCIVPRLDAPAPAPAPAGSAAEAPIPTFTG